VRAPEDAEGGAKQAGLPTARRLVVISATTPFSIHNWDQPLTLTAGMYH